MKLEAQDLSFAYVPETLALQDISFTLAENEILYVLGRNGSGKTTLLSCLSGVQRPTRGRAVLDGVDIREHSPAERARQIGLVPQIHVPVFAYTVREMVLMGRAPHLGLFGSPRRADYEVADAALESVGLAHLRDRSYTEVSGGERQLVMIARGLAQQSRILLLDEPDAHLDPQNQHLVLELVVRLARQQGLAFIISSHAPNNALFYADRVLLLKEGRVLALDETLATLTASLLTMAYDMETEIIYGSDGDGHIPRAIVPRRPSSAGDPPGAGLGPAPTAPPG